MTMCHYSVFSYLAHTKDRMLSDTLPLFPEDVFALLDTCKDNVFHFFKSVHEIFDDFGRRAPQLPTQEPFLCSREDRVKPISERGGFVRAKEYRDVMIHNPVFGRIVDKTTEALPHWTVLGSVKCSWRAVDTLKPSDWISCHDLFEALYLDITEFLQDEWESIIGAMEDLRQKPQQAAKFKIYWALGALMPITAPTITLRLDVPPPAFSTVSVPSVIKCDLFSDRRGASTEKGRDLRPATTPRGPVFPFPFLIWQAGKETEWLIKSSSRASASS